MIFFYFKIHIDFLFVIILLDIQFSFYAFFKLQD